MLVHVTHFAMTTSVTVPASGLASHVRNQLMTVNLLIAKMEAHVLMDMGILHVSVALYLQDNIVNPK